MRREAEALSQSLPAPLAGPAHLPPLLHATAPAAPGANTVVVPAYTRFDLTAAYKQPNYDVRLNVYNLFNSIYYDGIIASDGGRAVMGAGTTGMITLNYRL